MEWNRINLKRRNKSIDSPVLSNTNRFSPIATTIPVTRNYTSFPETIVKRAVFLIDWCHSPA